MNRELHVYLGLKTEVQYQALQMLQAYYQQECVYGEHSIPQFTISLKDADGYVISPQKVLLDELRKNDLVSEDYGYSAFRLKLKPRILETGTYYAPGRPNSNEMFVCRYEETHDQEPNIIDDPYDLVHYLGLYETKGRAAFVIYRLSCLEMNENGLNPMSFINPDDKLSAVVAVVDVEFE